jgi:hypothetical protein
MLIDLNRLEQAYVAIPAGASSVLSAFCLAGVTTEYGPNRCALPKRTTRHQVGPDRIIGRAPALRRKLDLLERTLEKLHDLPEDLALARQADFHGLGGASAR